MLIMVFFEFVLLFDFIIVMPLTTFDASGSNYKSKLNVSPEKLKGKQLLKSQLKKKKKKDKLWFES